LSFKHFSLYSQNFQDRLLEKEKTAQLLAIKAGEFQALTRVLEVLKTEELKVELDSVGN